MLARGFSAARAASGQVQRRYMVGPGCRWQAAIVFYNELERGVGRVDQRFGATVELVAEAALGGGEQQALVGEARRRINAELEPGEMADRLRPDAHLAVGGDRHRQRDIGCPQAPMSHWYRVRSTKRCELPERADNSRA